MRLVSWIVPAVGFSLMGAYVVLHDPAAQPPEVPANSSPDPAWDIVGGVEQLPVVTLDDGASQQFTAPALNDPSPVWRVVDHGLAADALLAGDIPALPVSNAAPRRDITATKTAESRTPSPWEVVGQSARGRPIHIREFGDQGAVTLIVCGLDGEDRIAVKWIDSLSQQLAAAPEMASKRRIVLLRDPNPDGLTAKRRANERGVLLNRNFPTTGYRPGEQAGPGPASEAETRVVLEVLYRFQPERVIHVQSAGRSQVVWSESAERLAHLLQEGRQLDAQPLDLAREPGSLEEFAASTLSAEVLTMRLATGDDWRSAAIGHFPTLMAAAAPQIAEQSFAVAQTSRREPISADEDLAASPFSAGPALTRLERRGYEELPPPPGRRNQ